VAFESWSDFADDLWFEPRFHHKTVDAIDPLAVRFFDVGSNDLHGGSVMNEITVAVAALRAAADAMEALSKKLSLDAFDPPLDEKGTPPPTVGALKVALGAAAQKHGRAAVEKIVVEEASGARVDLMTEDQRLMTLIGLNLLDAQVAV
jgi:hypothetical protein